jgi:hypothetical protein
MNFDRNSLVVARIGAQDPQSGAIVDCGVLVVALLLPGLTKWFNEFHVHLQLVAGSLFLVALPPGLNAFVAPKMPVAG